MNIDPSTPAREERDEFDGLPLNPKQIASVIQYLDMSPRDNLKQLAKKIIQEYAEEVQKLNAENESQSTEILQQEAVIDDLIERRDWYKNQYDRAVESNGSLVLQIEALEKKPSLTSRIALWLKKRK